jgi:hypothetical protein
VNRDSQQESQEYDKLGKKELLQMLSFGADQIFQNAGKLPTDEEIDAIIDRGQKTMTTTNTSTDTSGDNGNGGSRGSSSNGHGGGGGGCISTKASWSSSSSSSPSSSGSGSSSGSSSATGGGGAANDDADDAATRSTSFTSGTSNAADFEADGRAVSLRQFQGIEYIAKKAEAVGMGGAGTSSFSSSSTFSLPGGASSSSSSAGLTTEQIAMQFHERASRDRKSRFVQVMMKYKYGVIRSTCMVMNYMYR